MRGGLLIGWIRLGIQVPETEGGTGVSLRRGLLQPHFGLGRIARTAEAIQIERGEQVLRLRVARIREALQVRLRRAKILQPDCGLHALERVRSAEPPGRDR